MGKAYSVDLRERILANYDSGVRPVDLARSYRVPRSCIYEWISLRRESGSVTPKIGIVGRKPSLLKQREQLQKLVAERPDATLHELAALIKPKVSHTTIWRTLAELKLTLKKVIHAAEQKRPDVAERRAVWRLQQAGMNPNKLVFIDETWAKTNMARTRGRALRGERLIDFVPHGHWKTTTFLAALRRTGLTAPLVVDGAVNGEIFLAYVKQHLIHTLKRGDIVVMDNLSSHKCEGVREAIESVKAKLLYLPPYSPDFNPIEQVFSKLKSLLRKHAERTVEALWKRIGTLLDCFSKTECMAYFRHSGYCPD